METNGRGFSTADEVTARYLPPGRYALSFPGQRLPETRKEPLEQATLAKLKPPRNHRASLQLFSLQPPVRLSLCASLSASPAQTPTFQLLYLSNSSQVSDCGEIPVVLCCPD